MAESEPVLDQAADHPKDAAKKQKGKARVVARGVRKELVVPQVAVAKEQASDGGHKDADKVLPAERVSVPVLVHSVQSEECPADYVRYSVKLESVEDDEGLPPFADKPYKLPYHEQNLEEFTGIGASDLLGYSLDVIAIAWLLGRFFL